MSDTFQPAMDVDAITSFLAERFPQALAFPATIAGLGPRTLDLRLDAQKALLRPGGTIAGPVLMTLADTAVYLLILSTVGPVEHAVTTHLDIDFLRRPEPRDVIAHAELLKIGKTLAVARVEMRSCGDDRLVAHATVTYAVASG